MIPSKESALLVEDDDSLRSLLQQELEDLGLSVSSVASAEQALNEIERATPTLVLSDLRLPKMDGIALLERIQSSELARVPPFVIISAFGTVDRAVEALKRGAADFLTKPLDNTKLHAVLEDVTQDLNSRRRARALEESIEQVEDLQRGDALPTGRELPHVEAAVIRRHRLDPVALPWHGRAQSGHAADV